MFDLEVLYLARKSAYRIAQVPVRWKNDGDSRLQVVRRTIRYGLDVLSIPFAHRFANSSSLKKLNSETVRKTNLSQILSSLQNPFC